MGCLKLTYDQTFPLLKVAHSDFSAKEKKMNRFFISEEKSSAGKYSYSFNGMEKDDEVKGKGNSVNYKYRMSDVKLGRFFAIDPLVKEYPELTPYQFSSNNPIGMLEIEGLEGTPVVGIVRKPKPLLKLWKVKDHDAVSKEGNNFADKSKSRLYFGLVPRTRTVNQWRTIFTQSTVAPGVVNRAVSTNTTNPVRASIFRNNTPGRPTMITPGTTNQTVSFNNVFTPNFISDFFFNPGGPNDNAPLPQLGITTIPLGTTGVNTVTFNFTVITPGVSITYDVEELVPVTITTRRLGLFRKSVDRTDDTDNAKTEKQQKKSLGVGANKRARRKALRGVKKKR